MSNIVPVNSNYHEVLESDHVKIWKESKSEKYNLYRKKWEENPSNFIDEGFPLNLDIEASSACNLKCTMCDRTIFSDSERWVKSRHFDFDLYQRLIDEAVDIGVYAIKLNWRGEPLLNPRIVDMVKYAKDKGIEDVIMNTNAVLLTEEMSRDLIAADIDRLFFSFDSVNKETYEKIRVGANFDDVLYNIKRFMEIRSEMKSLSPLTRVSMVKLPENENERQQYIDIFGDIVDIVAFDDFIDFNRDYSDLKNQNIIFACSQPWQRLVIGSDGEVGICCFDTGTACGLKNIKESNIKEIWTSSELKQIRERHKDLQWKKIPVCSTCPYVLLDASGSV